jgi:hypothetical protein
LFQQSETFENAAWTKNNISVATGIGTTPEGLPYRILTNTVNGFNHLTQTPPLVVNSFYSVTIVLKKGTAISVGFRVGAGTWGDAKYNFDTDAFVGSGVAFASRRFLGDGWIEIKYQNFEALQTNFRVFISSSTTGNSLDGLIGQTLLVSKMQISVGSTAKPYFPTTDRLNVPRLTYQNGGGGCPSLLLEAQRTNLTLYSEQFDNVNWFKQGATITANSIVSPDGTQNADTIIEDSANSLHRIISAGISTTNGIYTASAFIKKGTRRYVILSVVQALDSIYVCIDTDNSTITQSSSTGTYVYSTSSVINLTNGWIRCTLTGTITIGAVLSVALSNTATPNNASFQYTGNGSYAYAWGAQLELGSYASSYIPTTSASATRIADACSKTGISSLIGQTEGTLFFDGIVNAIQNASSNIVNTNRTATTISTIALTKVKATNKIRFEQFLGNGTFVNIPLLSTNSFADGVRTKVAIRYKSGDFAMYINGNLEATNASTFTNIGVKTELYLNDVPTTFAYQESVSFNQLILFTALTNSELATLTTI